MTYKFQTFRLAYVSIYKHNNIFDKHLTKHVLHCNHRYLVKTQVCYIYRGMSLYTY